jgi:hypothetical protein
LARYALTFTEGAIECQNGGSILWFRDEPGRLWIEPDPDRAGLYAFTLYDDAEQRAHDFRGIGVGEDGSFDAWSDYSFDGRLSSFRHLVGRFEGAPDDDHRVTGELTIYTFDDGGSAYAPDFADCKTWGVFEGE